MKLVFAILGLAAFATMANATQCSATVTVSASGGAKDVTADLTNCTEFDITWQTDGSRGSSFAVFFGDIRAHMGGKPVSVLAPCKNGFAFTSAWFHKTCTIPNTAPQGSYEYVAVGPNGATDPKVIVTGTGLDLDHKHQKHHKKPI